MSNKTEKCRAPKIGYSSEAKQEYRKQVWDAIISQVGTCGNFLILPSKDGEEIDYLIERGIPQSRIICIDENPALIASAPWRKKYKSIKAYGVKASNVAARLEKAKVGSISAANLDLCNNFSEELVNEVFKFLSTVPLSAEFSFSVTVSKGREQSATNYLMNLLMQTNSWSQSDYTKLKEKRISCLMRIVTSRLPRHWMFGLVAEGSYIHHKTPMAWSVFSIKDTKRHPKVAEMIEKAKFEWQLWCRCKFYLEANIEYSYRLKNLIESGSEKEIKEIYPDVCKSVSKYLSTDWEIETAKARMIVNEHKEIEAMYVDFCKNSLDWDCRFCPILYELGMAGVDNKDISRLSSDLEWFFLLMPLIGKGNKKGAAEATPLAITQRIRLTR